MKNILRAILFLFVSTNAYSSSWDVKYNEHGAVLTRGDYKIYLGVSCDAYSEAHGKGRWSWGNGGFNVYFENHVEGFPRQELSIFSPECRENGNEISSESKDILKGVDMVNI